MIIIFFNHVIFNSSNKNQQIIQAAKVTALSTQIQIYLNDLNISPTSTIIIFSDFLLKLLKLDSQESHCDYHHRNSLFGKDYFVTFFSSNFYAIPSHHLNPLLRERCPIFHFDQLVSHSNFFRYQSKILDL